MREGDRRRSVTASEVAFGFSAVLLAGVLGVALAVGTVRAPGSAATHSTPSPTALASPSPSPTPEVADLNCKIAMSETASGSGVWITFPGGFATADPSSNVSARTGLANLGFTYDVALKQWVPVPMNMLRPDGLMWAIPSDYDRLAFEVPAGELSQRGVPIKNYGVGFQPLIFEPEGVYVAHATAGLYLITISGFGSHFVTEDGWWQAVRGGYAYGTATPILPNGAYTVILRLNVTTGASGPWFSRKGMQSRVVGFALNGDPVILASGGSGMEIWLASSSPRLLHSFPEGVSVNSVAGDAHGIWVATGAGLFQWSDLLGWRFASSHTGFLASTCI